MLVFLFDDNGKTAECFSDFGGNINGIKGSMSTLESTLSFSPEDALHKQIVCVVLIRPVEPTSKVA